MIKKIAIGLILCFVHTYSMCMEVQRPQFLPEETKILECFQRALHNDYFRDKKHQLEEEILKPDTNKKKRKKKKSEVTIKREGPLKPMVVGSDMALYDLITKHPDCWKRMAEFLKAKADEPGFSKYMEIRRIAALESKNEVFASDNTETIAELKNRSFFQGFFFGAITFVGLYSLYKWIKGK